MKLEQLDSLLPGEAPTEAILYRLVLEKFKDSIDEIGPSILRGWRYNPKGEFGALYLAKDPECAFEEILKQAGGRRDFLLPYVLGSFRHNLSKCLNLTSKSVRETLAVSREDLTNEADYTIPQIIARQARKLGFEAIQAPSAIGDSCHNVVVFKDRLIAPSYCVCEISSIRPYP